MILSFFRQLWHFGKSSQWFRRRRAVGFDRAAGQVQLPVGRRKRFEFFLKFPRQKSRYRQSLRWIHVRCTASGIWNGKCHAGSNDRARNTFCNCLRFCPTVPDFFECWRREIPARPIGTIGQNNFKIFQSSLAEGVVFWKKMPPKRAIGNFGRRHQEISKTPDLLLCNHGGQENKGALAWTSIWCLFQANDLVVIIAHIDQNCWWPHWLIHARAYQECQVVWRSCGYTTWLVWLLIKFM